MSGSGVEPDRHRRGRSGRPWRGARGVLVPTVVLAIMLGVVVGVAATRTPSRQQPAASPPTAIPSTTSLQAPATSVIPPATSVIPPGSVAPPATAPDPSATTSTPAKSSTSTATSRQPPAKPDAPILQQRRPVPAGVFAQMLTTQGGADGSACNGPALDVTSLKEPTIAIGTDQRPNFATVEVANPIQLCLWRFEPGSPIQVTVRYPNGRVTQSVGYSPCARDECYSHVNWAAIPGDPLGDYKVTAVQGQLRAQGTVRVVAATRRNLLVVGNGVDEYQYQTFKRGQTIRVAVAGYPPRSSVQLFVYYTHERALQRRTTVLRFRTWIQLRIDSRGGAVYQLRTAAGDPPGCYALDTRPKPQALLRFEETDLLTHVVQLNVKATEPLFCLT